MTAERQLELVAEEEVRGQLTVHDAAAEATACTCTLHLQGGTILPSSCPVAVHRYGAHVAAYNAARAEKRAATTSSDRQRRYSAERAAAMRKAEADSLRWAAEATCTAARP